MIVEISRKDEELLRSVFRLRYQSFIERQNYAVPSVGDMEYDTYDNPATVYLAWLDDQNVVRGCTRLICTAEPYMIEQLWPDSVEFCPLPKSPSIWEASRFCIDKSVEPAQRRRIHAELLCAFQEYGLAHKIDSMIGVMTPLLWRSVFIHAGWPIEFLGPVTSLNAREKIIAGKMTISTDILSRLRIRHQVEEKILAMPT